ncbi:hypothetical protein FQA39_LY01871 [Lamprigera yunnana]|nr:hypothetical protein FQA39_LY01871 [Lamprigera yunnana]
MAKESIVDDNTSLILHNQELEEAEELEERRRREEEMHSLISHAMGQFNFDEQSTINSSLTSNEGESSVVRNNASLEEHYRDANPHNQLQILYDVRVREVERLNKKLNQFKNDFNVDKMRLEQQVTLLQIDNQRALLSLNESQAVLVDKVEQIRKLEAELTSLKIDVNNLNEKIKEMEEENEVVRQLNAGLEEQMVVMQRAPCPLKSNGIDKNFHDSLRIKVDQLESLLQHTQDQLKYSTTQHKQLLDEFKRTASEKNTELAEKNFLIDSLSNRNDLLQEQLMGCLKTIEERKEQLISNEKGKHLEEELRKIHQTEELHKKVRQEVMTEFQSHITSLSEENEKLLQDLKTLKMQLKELHHDKEILRILQTENQELEGKYGKLYEKYNEMIVEKMSESKQLKDCEEEKYLLQKKLDAETQLTNVLKNDYEKLQRKIFETTSSLMTEKSSQTSLPFNNDAEFLRNHEKLETQVKHLQEDNAKLQVKIGLEQEREGLIIKLQEQASEFEKIIQERQQKSNQMVSTGTNTTEIDDNSLLKMKCETFLYQTEAKVHRKLKKQFDEKLLMALKEYGSLHKCKDCNMLKEEVKKLLDLRQQDRVAVLKLISMWEIKFSEIEKEAKNEISKLTDCKQKSELVISQQNQLLRKKIEEFKILHQHVEKYQSKEKFEVIFKQLNNLKTKIQQGNNEIKEMEKRFHKFMPL